jgi:hypothetical protein
MTTPALFDAAQLSASLALERGDTVITYTTFARFTLSGVALRA